MCPVCAALAPCSAGVASVPGLVTSTWTWPSVPLPVPPPLHRPPGLFCVSSIWKPLLGGGYVMNPVQALPVTHHQRSLAHHIDSLHHTNGCTSPKTTFPITQCTDATQLIALITHLIALITNHTADCTDH